MSDLAETIEHAFNRTPTHYDSDAEEWGFFVSEGEKDDIVLGIEALRTRLAEAERLLKEVEWSDDGCMCPACSAFSPDFGGKFYDGPSARGVHAPDCALAAFLNGAERNEA